MSFIPSMINNIKKDNKDSKLCQNNNILICPKCKLIPKIFINELNPDIKINTEYFEKNGIQVILFVKINQKSDETKILKIFNDTFNIITFYNYSSLNNYFSTSCTNNNPGYVCDISDESSSLHVL